MPKYTQTLRFTREVEIEAKNAAEANQRVMDIIHDAEFGGDVTCDGYYDFEDEDVECPDCKGDGSLTINDVPDMSCPRCGGEGYIPFPG